MANPAAVDLGPANAELVLHHAPHTRSATAHWMLEELGQPYRLQLVDLKKNEQQGAAFLVVNPMGKVPALSHRGSSIAETAAICAYLADAFPQAGLSVPASDPQRGAYLKWLFFGPGSLEPLLIDHMLKRDAGSAVAQGYGDAKRPFAVLAQALEKGPYLLGERFTAADVVIGAGLGWGRYIQAVPDEPRINAYIERLEQRPARQRAVARDAQLAGQAG